MFNFRKFIANGIKFIFLLIIPLYYLFKLLEGVSKMSSTVKRKTKLCI